MSHSDNWSEHLNDSQQMRKSMKPLLIILVMLILAIFSCEDLEPINPADPAYTLKAPILASVQAITDIQIDIAWQKNEEHTEEFVILRKSGSEPYSSISTVTKDVLSYIDTTCILGVSYSYVIISKVESNLSAVSNAMTIATMFPSVTNIHLNSLSDVAVQITWEDNCDFEAGYIIERESESGFLQVAIVETNITSYTDGDLNYGADYKYRVAGYTSNNTSSWTTSSVIDVGFPPTDLIVTVLNDSNVLLAWTDNSENEEGFRIERDSGSGFLLISEVGSNIINYNDNNLDYGNSYIYRIAGYSANHISGWTISDLVNVTILAPSFLSALAISMTEIELSWTDNCSFEEGFYVERDSGLGYEPVEDLGSNVTTYIDNDLIAGSSYSYRVSAYTNVNSSGYSATATATTASLIDVDGNMYAAVQIGSQTWMSENLKVTHFRNGDAIPTAHTFEQWLNLSTSAYAVYNDAEIMLSTFGCLYNWYAVTDNRNIAPVGWHVPTDAEWKELEMNLGMSQLEVDGTDHRGTNEGAKLKSIVGWNDGGNGNNASGFTAIPGGQRSSVSGTTWNGGYGRVNLNSYFWCGSEISSWSRSLSFGNSGIYRTEESPITGFSVRCIKD
jgi:uncharacterized protein (TIGR02145 family)